jgi:AbrB family looped-hinge helix DNA binding protein
MSKTKVGGRYHVVLPKEIREALNLKPVDYLEVKVVDGAVIMIPQASYTSQLFGKHQEIWLDEDAVNYVRRERESLRDYIDLHGCKVGLDTAVFI